MDTDCEETFGQLRRLFRFLFHSNWDQIFRVRTHYKQNAQKSSLSLQHICSTTFIPSTVQLQFKNSLQKLSVQQYEF